MNKITKIVITGGPCAGKTTAMSWVQNEFSKRGYAVLFVPETATELITAGVSPATCHSADTFQKLLLDLQFEKERIFESAAEKIAAFRPVLIVCDRGFMDCSTYMEQESFDRELTALGLNCHTVRDQYDAVFHLVTAAKGASQYYTTANNMARSETVEQAAAADDRLIAAWTGHPHFRMIDNSTEFEGKMLRLIAEIAAFLGEEKPFYAERKFLIDYPDIARLEADKNCRRVQITQTYLNSVPGVETRIRRRDIDGNFLYYQATKRMAGNKKRVEIERRLSPEEYSSLLTEADPLFRTIQKTRYCLTYQGQYFEVDIYPFWQDKAILEIELSDENAPILFPEQFHVIREVTDDEAYKNSSIARMDSGSTEKETDGTSL